MELNIRKVNKKDLKKLAEIYNRVYSPANFDIGEKWDEESAYSLLNYWLKRQPDLAFLAESNGRAIGGFFVGVKPWWDGNHLVDGEIFVDPNYQNHGVGTELSKFMFEYAIKKYNVVKWDTYTFKGKYPLRWYKSLGFEEIKEWSMISANIEDVLKRLR